MNLYDIILVIRYYIKFVLKIGEKDESVRKVTN